MSRAEREKGNDATSGGGDGGGGRWMPLLGRGSWIEVGAVDCRKCRSQGVEPGVVVVAPEEDRVVGIAVVVGILVADAVVAEDSRLAAVVLRNSLAQEEDLAAEVDTGIVVAARYSIAV